MKEQMKLIGIAQSFPIDEREGQLDFAGTNPSNAKSTTIMPMDDNWAIRIGKAWASRPRAAVKSMGRDCRTHFRTLRSTGKNKAN